MRHDRIEGSARRLLVAAFALCGVLAVLPQPGRAASTDDVFTIGNYPVDAQAADAVAAKKAAIAAGEMAALRSLFKRLVPVSAYPRLHQIQIANAEAFVDGISVRSERNSSTEYIANLDFSFRADAVRALLERERIPYVVSKAPVIKLVPIWRAQAEPIPGVEADAWMVAWQGVDTVHALTPLAIVPLKPGVHPDTIAALAKGDTTMLRTLAGEYGGEERLVAAILVPELKSGKLKVTLVGRDTVGSLSWTKSYTVDASDPGYAIELAAIVSLGVLEGRWKATGARVQGPVREPGTDGNSPFSTETTGGDLRLAVQFRDIGEWATLSKRLADVPGVANIDVLGLSGRSARITLQYPGGVEQLAQVASQYGLQLRQGAGGWVLSGP